MTLTGKPEHLFLLEGHLIAPFLEYLKQQGYEVIKCNSAIQPYVVSKYELNHFIEINGYDSYIIPNGLSIIVFEFYKQHE